MDNKITNRLTFLSNQKKSGHQITVGFTGVADFRSFIDKNIIAGMLQASKDYDVNFINMSYAAKQNFYEDLNFIPLYLKKFQFIKAPFLDGVITWASSLCQFLPSDKVVEHFSTLKSIPMVDIGYLDIPDVPSIRIDNSQSMHLIISHLVKEHNYKNFIFLGAEGSQPNIRRLNAFQKELEIFNLPKLPNSIYLAKSQKANYISEILDEILEHYSLEKKKEIDAIITPSDIIAAEIISQLHQRGFSVPNDVAVTGYNNWYDGLIAETPITTINLEYYKRGYLAVEMLIDKIAQPNLLLENKLLSTSLVIRDSCGCLDQSIYNAFYNLENDKENTEISNETSQNIHQYLEDSINKTIPFIPRQFTLELIKGFFQDIFNESKESLMLVCFQQIIRYLRKTNPTSNSSLQDTVSNLRRIFIPLVNDNPKQLINLENILHQMRILISVYQNYQLMTVSENPYLSSSLSQVALSFDEPRTKEELFSFLDQQLTLFDISWAVFAFSQVKSYNLPPCQIEYIFPHNQLSNIELPYNISEPHSFPQDFLPQNRPFALVLEIFNHDDYYLGYAFLQLSNTVLANYNALRPILNKVFINYFKITQNKPSLQIISQLENKKIKQNSRQRIYLKNITDYMISHITEMTNIDKMAKDFHVSRSYLIKKCKEITGMSIQELNEKIKIQRAMELLKKTDMSLTQLAREVGFKNQNYFSTVFKKVSGETPSQWLKKHIH